ncbi:MAG: OmpA family protein [Oscillatoriales cyanobacterium C42_A2020_001]|nr:OmpA family protein [Leptolyngbyaceae cyanobacterium C42_A2020_001]
MNQKPLFTTSLMLLGLAPSAFADPLPVVTPPSQPLRLVVTSNQDIIQPDASLTLREAISIVNGTLPVEKLSDAEKAQLSPASRFAIEFNLPADQTTIRLVEVLPPLAVQGMAIDGTTQPGYQGDRSAINELPMPIPVVTITPAEGKEVFRGLTVEANNITIRGLSLYGFTSNHQNTASTPPADIFIAHRFAPPALRKHPTPANFSPFYADDTPAQRTIIENNWIGIPPSADGSARTTGTRSAFGVSVFNGDNTIIRRNWIADHEGSAIITGANAEKMEVTENVITSNGLAGMPDAIRLEGEINQSQITGNLICGNDGSGIYLFKPSGSVEIRDNQVTYNGRRFRRAAVYLMGSNHTVRGNQISYQAGPGVVVAAYPESQRATILSNRFVGLEGLSIDLAMQQNTDVFDYQKGDGPNPIRNSFFRRLETGNAAINPPQFVTQEFVGLGKSASTPDQVSPVEIFGKADPGSQVELYRVSGNDNGYGSLTQPIATIETKETGEFSTTLNDLKVGDQISAIAVHPLYGTSEQAPTVRIRAADGTPAETPASQPPSSAPQCVTAAPPPVEQPPPPEPIILRVPKNVHFALDKDFISPASAKVLDKVAAALLENPTIIIELQGHTDPRATDAYNLDLGARRARNTRNYLLRKGVTNERMTIRSFGERQRATQGSSKVDFARDRRVEIDYKDARDIEVIVQETDLQIEP